ncbi:TPA: hypothetical protein ACGCOG_RS24680, partial [Escherichia coli]
STCLSDKKAKKEAILIIAAMHDHNDKSEAEFRSRNSHMRNDISSTNTLYLGIASKPQNLGVALTTQTTGSFRNFMIELQICNSPTSQRNFALSGISTSYLRSRSGVFHW